MSRRLYPTQFRLIEEEAENLLVEYGTRFTPIVAPPIPIEMIAERLLKLHCEIGKLGQYGRGVLGVLLVDQQRILIDERSADTQFNFTIAHEIGHWRFHRTPDTMRNFVDTSQTISPLLRSTRGRSRSEKAYRAEIEANQFAAALLIPQSLLISATSNYQVIEARAVAQLASSFQTAISTMLYRIIHLERYFEFLEKKVQLALSHVDLASIYNLEESLQK